MHAEGDKNDRFCHPIGSQTTLFVSEVGCRLSGRWCASAVDFEHSCCGSALHGPHLGFRPFAVLQPESTRTRTKVRKRGQKVSWPLKQGLFGRCSSRSSGVS
jgi:hypothetical protein